jgi:hypothetical protein
MLDDERVLVEAVEPDESTEDHWLITVSDGEGHARDPISFSGRHSLRPRRGVASTDEGTRHEGCGHSVGFLRVAG